MHLSDNALRLEENIIKGNIADITTGSANVEFVILPYFDSLEAIPNKEKLFGDLKRFISLTDSKSTITILSSPIFAADFSAVLNGEAYLKLWVAVKLEEPITLKDHLTEKHAALLVLTRYKESLKHTKTRIGYTYCPSCDRTTKDYGGKKHLYHEFGTLMSDVWRDVAVDFQLHPKDIVNRLSDLFGLSSYKSVNVYDQREFYRPIIRQRSFQRFSQTENNHFEKSLLLNGDSLEQLKAIPENSIDFCFADPPYNLKKKYENWNDEIDIKQYFEWCDIWLSELARVLKPGRTLAVLNIPQWSIRHFKHLKKILDYQDWIVWEGLSMPVRMIMPAHYSILCFTKGKPRPLPGLVRTNHSSLEMRAIETLSENFCLRQDCVTKRRRLRIKDTEMVSNLWWDIHRLKHNSRRVDHPCQLPPMIMYRLISLFTNEGEFVLDPFNGAATTTLAAQQLNRKYVGIELSGYYHKIATQRHQELMFGLNPFRKNNDDTPKAKNSPVERLKKQKYEVSKKALQLEIKSIARQLGRIPTKEEVTKLSKYPIEYYENYFVSWGEVTAAARTTGMTEFKTRTVPTATNTDDERQLKLFKQHRKKYKKDRKKMDQAPAKTTRPQSKRG